MVGRELSVDTNVMAGQEAVLQLPGSQAEIKLNHHNAVTYLGALARTEDDVPWQTLSLCAQVDPEIFYPEKGGSTKPAKQVCLSCEVRTECLEDALKNDDRFGVRGGLNQAERNRLRKRQKRLGA